MRQIIPIITLLLLLSCSKEYTRDNEPMLIFNTIEYPTLDGTIIVNEKLVNQKLTFAYKNGLNRKVTISAKEQIGLYIPQQEVQLADEGTFSISLEGEAKEVGAISFVTDISYNMYHIIVNKEIGVRPAVIDDLEIMDTPTSQGNLYRGLEANTLSFSFNYQYAWGDKATIWFETTDSGILEDKETYVLALDGSINSLEVSLQGIPKQVGLIDITMFVELENGRLFSYLYPNIEVTEAIEYEEETISHTIVVTDRNDLMSRNAVIATAKFEYKTIFVDMNGDGYVSGNHEIWLDRNVGATSTNSNTKESYGFIYQTGRAAPGWVSGSQTGTTYKGEKYAYNNANWFNGTANSVVINTLDANGKVDGQITVEAGKIGPNNPCPQGFRPPTANEWTMLYNHYGSTNTSHEELKNGEMKLPFRGGFLANINTQIQDVGTKGYYWCSPVDNNQVPAIYFATTPPISNRPKGYGLPIRCVKAKESELATY